jgi:hypothetical protein
MNKQWGMVLGFLAVGVGVACGGGKTRTHSPPDEMASLDAGTEPVWEGDSGGTLSSAPEGGTPVAEVASGTEEGAKSLLKQFVDPKADHEKLSKSLRPTAADYKALFDDAVAAKMEAAYAKEWDAGHMVIKPKNEKQSEIKLWGATGADLAEGKGHAKEFPGGYKKIAKHLSPTVTFYAFKFVERGKDAGMAYDGLAYVNAHWVIVPKPFHVEGGDDKADKGDKGDHHDKPAGKPHGKKKK